MSEDRNILNFIRNLCANGESGRLEILAGAIQGELSFAEGKLVDARFGHLKGFPAINAVVAMRNAHFSFDTSFTPLASSSITASERVVLKQFFGIETAAANEYLNPVGVDWPEETAPVAIVSDAPDEVTIVRSNVVPAEIPRFLLPPSRFSYQRAVAFAAVVIVLIAAVAVLMYKFREPGPQAVVATAESLSRPAPVQQHESPIAARDLSGKWNVVNTIDTTSYAAYKNMKIGFALSIDQTGSTFTGNGNKVSENGRSLPSGNRTPIKVKGSINGDRIEATFFEEGTARKSNGRFVWRMDKAGRGLTGNFATTAARSSGKSAATRSL